MKLSITLIFLFACEVTGLQIYYLGISMIGDSQSGVESLY
jgi:hypothetical protein